MATKTSHLGYSKDVQIKIHNPDKARPIFWHPDQKSKLDALSRCLVSMSTRINTFIGMVGGNGALLDKGVYRHHGL